MPTSRSGGWTLSVACACLCIASLSPHPVAAPLLAAQAGAAANDDHVLRGLQTALDGYASLRARLRDEVPPLRVTPNAQEIAQASDALARAVARARRNARPGQFFDAAAATEIRRRLAAALTATDDAAIRALIDEDMTTFGNVRVHARYPVGYVLPTTPAVLLLALPTLPSQLEYRFIGRTLILRDIDAALIVDLLPNALPAR